MTTLTALVLCKNIGGRAVIKYNDILMRKIQNTSLVYISVTFQWFLLRDIFVFGGLNYYMTHLLLYLLLIKLLSLLVLFEMKSKKKKRERLNFQESAHVFSHSN